MSISQCIAEFATLAIKNGGYMEMDRIYVQNKLLAFVGENDFKANEVAPAPIQYPEELLEKLTAKAVANQQISDTKKSHEDFKTMLWDFITPPPSVVNAWFSQLYAKDPAAATTYLYELKQPQKKTAEELFLLPEKLADYPQCIFCFENEGYAGRAEVLSQASRRLIRLNLDQESWGLFFAAKEDHEEQCFFVSEKHEPFLEKDKMIKRLLQLMDLFPQYFISVNGARSPHGYYEGGRSHLPVEEAEVLNLFAIKDAPQVVASVLNWPCGAIRLQSADRSALKEALSQILRRAVSDQKIPLAIARKKENYDEIHLLLLEHTDKPGALLQYVTLHESQANCQRTKELQAWIKAWT